MKRFDLLSRCFGLLLAVALAMPAETSASFVTGGDLGDCSYSGTELESCGSVDGGNCTGQKAGCICSGSATFGCTANATGAPCGGQGCNSSDKHDSTTNDCDTVACD